MQYIKYISLIIIALSFTSCEDFFEVSVPIDIENQESKLALSSHFIVYSDEGIVEYNTLLSKSMGALENSDEDNYKIQNATMALNQGTNAYTMLEDGNVGYYNDIQGNWTDMLTPGATCIIKAQKTGFPDIEAQQIFPSKIPVVTATLDNELLKVTFQDPPGTENFYMIELLVFDDNNNQYWSYLEPFGGITRESGIIYNNVIFNDATFDGELKEITMRANFNEYGTMHHKVRLYHITQAMYNYDISYLLNQNSIDNPFAEPVILYSNVTNGYGVFTLSHVSTYEID